jgi:hypothetical protein
VKKSILISFQFFFFITTYSQPSFNFFLGYGKTLFENVTEQTDYIPAGAQLMFGVPLFNFGIEASYTMTPIIYDIRDTYTKKELKQLKFNQFFIGQVIKINLTKGNFIPYMRMGTGLYTGKGEALWPKNENRAAVENGIIQQDYKFSLKNKMGFNLGGGFNLNISRFNDLFFEYIYHFISREENFPAGFSIKGDNWNFLVGYKINFM